MQILICQNLRNNLQHPNEYVRGVTLRFLCRIHEEEILEPLVPSITDNLEHRHSFVRRNAVMCLNELYKLPKGEQLFQDAPEKVATFLAQEQDVSAKRNAFMFLSNHDADRAVAYLSSQIDKLIDWGAILQMAVLDLIRKVRRLQRTVLCTPLTVDAPTHVSALYQAQHLAFSRMQACACKYAHWHSHDPAMACVGLPHQASGQEQVHQDCACADQLHQACGCL